MAERSQTERPRRKHAAKAAPTASRGPMKNPSRERLQADLHLFLTQAVRLELQVNELKEMKRQEQARILEAAAALSALVNLSTPSWQLQVLNEQKKREQAEEERDRLEQLINQQQHVISCLKRLLQQRMDMALPSSPGLPQGNSLWSLYGQFLHDIHVAYLMADEAMEDIDWAKIQRTRRHSETGRSRGLSGASTTQGHTISSRSSVRESLGKHLERHPKLAPSRHRVHLDERTRGCAVLPYSLCRGDQVENLRIDCGPALYGGGSRGGCVEICAHGGRWGGGPTPHNNRRGDWLGCTSASRDWRDQVTRRHPHNIEFSQHDG